MKRLRSLPLGSILGAVVAVYIAVILIQTVRHNYQLQKQIADQREQIKNLQASNQTLKYQIQYFNTDDYKEKEARAKLGLQAPGEGVVLLPHKDDGTGGNGAPTANQPKPAAKKSNWQQWIDFLSGK